MKNEITDILVELTDVIGYVHDSPSHREAYEKAFAVLNQMSVDNYNMRAAMKKCNSEMCKATIEAIEIEE